MCLRTLSSTLIKQYNKLNVTKVALRSRKNLLFLLEESTIFSTQFSLKNMGIPCKVSKLLLHADSRGCWKLLFKTMLTTFLRRSTSRAALNISVWLPTVPGLKSFHRYLADWAANCKFLPLLRRVADCQKKNRIRMLLCEVLHRKTIFIFVIFFLFFRGVCLS